MLRQQWRDPASHRLGEARRHLGADTGIMRADRRHPQARRILAQCVRVGPEIVDRDQRALLLALKVKRGFRRLGHAGLHAAGRHGGARYSYA
jgi:hypothetical protein